MTEFNNEGLRRLDESLGATGVLSPEYRRNVVGWAIMAVQEGHKKGRDDERERAAAPTPEGKVLVDAKRFAQMKQDMADMTNAAQTIFHRCACGRVSEQGIICPTVREGGDCEAGQ